MIGRDAHYKFCQSGSIAPSALWGALYVIATQENVEARLHVVELVLQALLQVTSMPSHLLLRSALSANETEDHRTHNKRRAPKLVSCRFA
jgi:hypothetical protein